MVSFRSASTALAIRWRDRAWRRIFGGEVPARSFHNTARSSSATGVPGVRFVTKKVTSSSNPDTIPYVMAEVHTVPGKDYRRSKGSRSRLFSLLTYEVDEAIALAIAWRAASLAELLEQAPPSQSASKASMAQASPIITKRGPNTFP